MMQFVLYVQIRVTVRGMMWRLKAQLNARNSTLPSSVWIVPLASLMAVRHPEDLTGVHWARILL